MSKKWIKMKKMEGAAGEDSHRRRLLAGDSTDGRAAAAGRSPRPGRNPVLFRLVSKKENNFTSNLAHAIQTGDTEQIQGRRGVLAFTLLLSFMTYVRTL